MKLWLSETEEIEVALAPMPKSADVVSRCLLIGLLVAMCGGWIMWAYAADRLEKLQKAAMPYGVTLGPGESAVFTIGGSTSSGTFTTWEPITVYGMPAHPKVGLDFAALDVALAAWHKEMGHPIKRPSLKFDPDGCAPLNSAIACASRELNTIWLTDEYYKFKRIDRVSTMLHEVGHLLGVPHVEDDALMRPVHNKIPSFVPSPIAVDIAKGVEAREGKSKQ